MQNWQGNTDMYIEQTLRKVFIQRPGYSPMNPDEFDMAKYRFIEIPDIPEVSSSLAKQKIQTSESVEGILSPQITKIIHDNELYQNER